MKRVIRLGDPTTHGGTVVSASSTTIINGIHVARLGDSVTCPIPGHGTDLAASGGSLFGQGARLLAGCPATSSCTAGATISAQPAGSRRQARSTGKDAQA